MAKRSALSKHALKICARLDLPTPWLGVPEPIIFLHGCSRQFAASNDTVISSYGSVPCNTFCSSPPCRHLCKKREALSIPIHVRLAMMESAYVFLAILLAGFVTWKNHLMVLKLDSCNVWHEICEARVEFICCILCFHRIIWSHSLPISMWLAFYWRKTISYS